MTQQARHRPERSNSLLEDFTARPPAPSMIVVGKDVLELLSSAMYVDPLSIYREYIQNAADAIDDARTNGVLHADERGAVAVTVDAQARSILIRDNGTGIPIDEAGARLLAIGASTKRGTSARGFRGVGRLAGLAYGRSLTFRTRSTGDDQVVELRWDCQRLKAALREVAASDDISSVIQRVVTISLLDGADWPAHFFEVELTDVIRCKRDALLSSMQIGHYLEQVAPIPFADGFDRAPQIEAHLVGVRLGDLHLSINGAAPLERPLADSFKVSDTVTDSWDELELLTLTDLNGGVAAKGWVLHHGYRGSITVRSQIAGLRLRVGNVQIGDENLLEEIFPETRFNGWSVGEIHVIDPRIVPNARRDHFEQNVHFSNLTAQLEPVGRQIAKRARAASIARNRTRSEELAQRASDISQVPARAAPENCLPIVEPIPVRPTLSHRQRLTVRKIRSIFAQSGLSVDEQTQVVAAIQTLAR
jgi:molecular chaperone HtpG